MTHKVGHKNHGEWFLIDLFLKAVVFFLPETIPGWENLTEPVKSRFYSAHFCFTLGKFAKEVQHDPEFYFHGEEISYPGRRIYSRL